MQDVAFLVLEASRYYHVIVHTLYIGYVGQASCVQCLIREYCHGPSHSAERTAGLYASYIRRI